MRSGIPSWIADSRHPMPALSNFDCPGRHSWRLYPTRDPGEASFVVLNRRTSRFRWPRPSWYDRLAPKSRPCRKL